MKVETYPERELLTGVLCTHSYSSIVLVTAATSLGDIFPRDFDISLHGTHCILNTILSYMCKCTLSTRRVTGVLVHYVEHVGEMFVNLVANLPNDAMKSYYLTES